jgi:hypothetical protein
MEPGGIFCFIYLTGCDTLRVRGLKFRLL